MIVLSDPNKIRHIFGQSRHNWNKTGLSQSENIRLVESIANDTSKRVSSTNLSAGGIIHLHEATDTSGNLIQVRIYEDANGSLAISTAWVL